MNEKGTIWVVRKKVSWKRVLIFAGAIIAFTLDQVLQTGQEIIQYYTAYGIKGITCNSGISGCFSYYNFNFAKAGAEQKFEKGNDVYKYFCGKYVGTFCDYYSTLFYYMSFFVMVGGASSTLHQEYGLPAWVGRSHSDSTGSAYSCRWTELHG